MNQEEINHLNKIEAVIKTPPTKESPGSNGFTTEFYQACKELIPILLKFSHEIEREGTLLKSFHEAIIIPISK
jgi:hypothetical protein